MPIAANLQAILAQIADTEKKAGRCPGETTLLVVSKTWPADVVSQCVDSHHIDYGENRVQEAAEKIPLLPDHLRWHLIGHLQKNKVRKAVELFPVIHSVDSLEMARRLDRIAGEEDRRPRIYLQVNIAREDRKFGFAPETLSESASALRQLENVDIHGLMTIPPFVEDPEKTRPHFAALRAFRDQLSEKEAWPLPGLSMGMSGDFSVAIEDGATIVRVGSSIFGTRQPWPPEQ
ncbi:MAG: YggS family pyridoxal phosphate-dependent enzyme [Verrucomicrobiota bacterium]